MKESALLDKFELWLSVLISKEQKSGFRLAAQNCLVEKGKENNKNDLWALNYREAAGRDSQGRAAWNRGNRLNIAGSWKDYHLSASLEAASFGYFSCRNKKSAPPEDTMLRLCPTLFLSELPTAGPSRRLVPTFCPSNLCLLKPITTTPIYRWVSQIPWERLEKKWVRIAAHP